MNAPINFADRAVNDEQTYRHKEVDFSLVLGGPLFQFFLQTRLTRTYYTLI